MGRIIHAIFKCTVCGVEYQDYLNAQRKARIHAENTGHVIRGEVGRFFVYPKEVR